MSTFQQTRASGNKFEEQLYQLLTRYSKYVWRNIKVETLLTANGYTEIDLLMVYKDIVFVIEAKNVSSIMGKYNSSKWSFVGSQAPLTEVKEYSALNVITQNGIHARSIQDLMFSRFQKWVRVIPVIVVPNGCAIDEDIASSIYTISQLNIELGSLSQMQDEGKTRHYLSALIADDADYLYRPDFHTVSYGKPRCKVV